MKTNENKMGGEVRISEWLTRASNISFSGNKRVGGQEPGTEAEIWHGSVSRAWRVVI